MELYAENISIKRGFNTVISNLSFAIKEQEILGIIGPSGTGKTSLLESILGLDVKHTTGSVFYNGNLLQNNHRIIVPLAERQFGYVPQDLALWPHVTVEKTLLLAQKFSHKAKNLMTHELLSWVGLTDCAQKKPHMLSFGEKKRLALARALITTPKLLILDEPFAGLDMVAKAGLIELMVKLKSSFNFLAIIVSHDVHEIQALATNVMVLFKSQRVWMGLSEKLDASCFPPTWNPFYKPAPTRAVSIM